MIERIKKALEKYAPLERGDHSLNNMAPAEREFADASVLILLVVRDDSISVLMTKRASHLAKHAGQVSFPGGKAESFDETPHVTALREAQEEVGIDLGRVEIIGVLDRYLTRTGFSITPVVGVIHGDFELAPDAGEVEAVFELPLSKILEPGAIEKCTREVDGVARFFYAITHEEWYIWGATAGMLKNLIDVITPELSCNQTAKSRDNPSWSHQKPKG